MTNTGVAPNPFYSVHYNKSVATATTTLGEEGITFATENPANIQSTGSFQIDEDSLAVVARITMKT